MAVPILSLTSPAISIGDTELGCHRKHQGYRIRLCKLLQVKHLKRWQSLSLMSTKFFCRALLCTEPLLSHQQITNELNFKVTTHLSVALLFTLVSTLIAALGSLLSIGLSLALMLLMGLSWSVYQFFYNERGFGLLCRWCIGTGCAYSSATQPMPLAWCTRLRTG